MLHEMSLIKHCLLPLVMFVDASLFSNTQCFRLFVYVS